MYIIRWFPYYSFFLLTITASLFLALPHLPPSLQFLLLPYTLIFNPVPPVSSSLLYHPAPPPPSIILALPPPTPASLLITLFSSNTHLKTFRFLFLNLTSILLLIPLPPFLTFAPPPPLLLSTHSLSPFLLIIPLHLPFLFLTPCSFMSTITPPPIYPRTSTHQTLRVP